MKNLNLILLISSILVACKNNGRDEKTINEITVIMTSTYVNNIAFHTDVTDLNFYSYYLQFPNYYKNIHNYKNIPVTNSGFISQYNFNKPKFFYETYLNGYMSDDQFESIRNQRHIDTINFPVFKFSDQITAFTGILDNKQIVTIDTDNDRDFSNELIQTFDHDFRKKSFSNPNLTKNLPTINHNYTILNEEGEFDDYNRAIVVFPSTDNIYSSIAEDTLNKELHLIGRIKDYWQGKIEYKDAIYDIVAQGISKETLQILIKPDSLTFSEENSFHNQEFEFRMADTIKLSEDSFVISKVEGNIESILLQKIDFKDFRGFRKREIIKDVDLIKLNDSIIKLSSLEKNRLILLDFWGTWCAPCLEHTPFLKYLDEKYKDDLLIVGVASDKVENIKKYTLENGMNWPQTYIKDKYGPKSISSKLRIEGFPTYILLDNNLNILYRETGSSDINKIEEAIISNLKKINK